MHTTPTYTGKTRDSVKARATAGRAIMNYTRTGERRQLKRVAHTLTAYERALGIAVPLNCVRSRVRIVRSISD